MDVIVAKYAGFCPGVKRAAEIALGEAKRNSVATYGPLVHNTEMIRALEEQGVGVAENLADIGQDTIVIRSHGVGAIELEELKATGKQVVDATCPHVGRIHRIAAETDRFLIIVGDPRHPEVKGIAGWAKSGHAIVPDARAAREVSADLPVAVVAQTTFQEDEYAAILEILKKSSPTFRFTRPSARPPASASRGGGAHRKVDMMLVIGGKHSANTQKLVKICLQSGVVTHHIQTKSDVDSRWFRGVNTVGIAAGASTPEWIIREVVEMVMDTNNEGIEEVKEDTNAILEQQSKPLAVGNIVVGTVVQVNPDEVLVDVGYKMEGLVRKDELSFRKVENCAELVSVGDELEAEVTLLTDDLLELSARKAAQGKAWKVVKEAFENQTPVTGKVVEVVKGGLIVDLGLRGFMPASLVDLRFVEDLSQFVGQEVTVLVIELEKRRNKVIVSRKAYLMQEAEAKKAETLANLEEGTTVKGIVRRLTNFGAFVDIGD